MLTSMILGILTIVLALAFSLLHLAAAFSAMKQKNYSLGKSASWSAVASLLWL